MSYTVHEVAALANISVRTLHYYDQIGLLAPESVRSNGYRLYGQPQMERLQQILFFRELEFSLEEIKDLLGSPRFNRAEALRDQRRLLELKKARLSKLIKTVTKTIDDMETEKPTKDETRQTGRGSDLYGSLSQSEIDAYKEEARQKWGHTEAYKQSRERTKHWTKEDYKRIGEEGQRHTQSIADLMDKGIDDPEVQAKIAQSRQNISVFYDCSLEMFRNLGQMYVDDPRFTAHYEKFRTGLAVFMRDAIALYCDNEAKKPGQS